MNPKISKKIFSIFVILLVYLEYNEHYQATEHIDVDIHPPTIDPSCADKPVCGGMQGYIQYTNGLDVISFNTIYTQFYKINLDKKASHSYIIYYNPVIGSTTFTLVLTEEDWNKIRR